MVLFEEDSIFILPESLEYSGWQLLKVDVSQESQKNRGTKNIALPIEGLWGGTVRSATSTPAMSRCDRSRSPRRSSGRRAATLADSFDDPKCSKDYNNRSPP